MHSIRGDGGGWNHRAIGVFARVIPCKYTHPGVQEEEEEEMEGKESILS